MDVGRKMRLLSGGRARTRVIVGAMSDIIQKLRLNIQNGFHRKRFTVLFLNSSPLEVNQRAVVKGPAKVLEANSPYQAEPAMVPPDIKSNNM